MAALCNRPEAFSSDLGDDQSRYLLCIVQPVAQLRMMAVRYAATVFPRDHVPSRYALLLACGDQ